MFGALCLLLGVCAIYTSGAWFFVATVSTLFGLMMIFVPIYIAKYDIFKSIRKYNDFISVAILFFMLLIMLAVIEHFTLVNGYSSSGWLYFSIVISTFVYMFLNLLLSVRFIKTNRFIKSSLILFIISTLYTWLPFIKVSNLYVQMEIDSLNIWQANMFDWSLDIPLERNIHLMIFLTLVVTAFILGFVGIVRTIRSKNK